MTLGGLVKLKSLFWLLNGDQAKCSERDKTEALSCNIRIIEATKRVGFEELDLLSHPPDDLQIDVVIGHGVELGRHVEIIREYRQCRWVQVVHTDPEEMAMFEGYTDSISKGEEKHKNEVKLCEMADFVVGIGPKVAEAFRSYLRPFRNEQTVFDLTPGIFEEFLSVKQVPEERKHRSVLVLGRGDAEDFNLKGFDIAGKAIASLAETDTLLIFVGAPDGKGEEIAESFRQCGLPANRLRVRGYEESRESLKQLFCEVDLMLMPSRTEGFGLTGLEALSAGLPVLVSKNSGFGEALCKVAYGSLYVIDSVVPEVWAENIRNIIWVRDRQNRLKEAEGTRKSYQTKYSWAKQSDDLLARIVSLVQASPPGVEAVTEGGAWKGTEMEEHPQEPQEVIHERREPSTIRKQQVVVNTCLAAENGGDESIQSTQAVLNRIVDKYLQHVCPSNVEQFIYFVVYLEKVRKELVLDPIKPGSLTPTVEVGSQEILEKLWKDYHEGHLNDMTQKFPEIRKLLEEFRLIYFKLTTFIAEEEYKACNYLVPRSPTVIRKGDLVKFDFEHAQCQRGPKYGLFYHCACSYSLL
ncbi:D-inositol 3-phosphate glycosyltransferase-like isoform X2 [Montipora foliosa]|uniref:D-inositol 3-phosphate glycosyltransferase-like isoform X2 n=1 Tax=Montipora foliosa TaxID=591990 RepID=UPI0035F1EE53